MQLTGIRRRNGFTLIELMVALSIMALLLVLAMPAYSVWLADAQIRTGAQTVAGGLRYAYSEAIKRNENIELVLDSTTKTGGWLARLVSSGATLQTGGFLEGADRVRFTTTPAGNNTVTFTGIGQIAPLNADATAPFDTVVVDLPAVAGSKDLQVLVGNNRTGIKICDPDWPANDPKGCPP